MKPNKKNQKLIEKNIEDILALTRMQEGMLFHYLENPDSHLYFEQLTLEISGEVNKEKVEKAWNFVIETNEMLRVVFRWKKIEKPLQVILKHHPIQPLYYDLTGGDNTQRRLQEIIVKDREKKFHLHQGEVPFRVTSCKIDTRKYVMIISSHHILYDGWSNGIILKEFFTAYNDFFNNEVPVKPAKTKFKEFIKWIQNQDKDEQEKYWRNELKGFDTPTEFSIKKTRAEEEKIQFPDSLNITFDKGTTARWQEFTGKHQITLATLLYTGWGILLLRYNNTSDVVFGTTVSGRSAGIKGIENMVGLFINTVPLRMQIDTAAKERAIDLCFRINKTLQAREMYEHTPLVKIREYSDTGYVHGKGLFDTIMVMENYPLDRELKLEPGSLPISIDSYSIFEMTEFDLMMRIISSEEVHVNFVYNRDRIAGEVIKKLSHHFTRILNDIIKHPGKSLHEIHMLSASEKARILFDFNETRAEYPMAQTLHGLFSEQVERTPDHVALVGKEEGWKGGRIEGLTEAPFGQMNAFGEMQLSYKELNNLSDRLVHLLIERGVKPDSIVGIMVERSVEMIVGIFGILKAGGAYMPIDPNYPQHRIDYMLKDSMVKVLFTTRDLSKNITLETEIINISCQPSLLPTQSASTSTCQVSSTNLAYIIYTSGSTGRPKGVMVAHTAVVNTLSALQRSYPLTSTDVYLLKTSYLFDVSVTELFGWYWQGGRLALLVQGGEKDPQKIIEAIKTLGITHINFVPSLFNASVERLHQLRNKIHCLKYIFVAGEAILPGLVKRFNEIGLKVSLENLYGPTEAAVYASGYSLSQWDEKSDVPIGKPIQNVNLYILDRNNQPQPINVPGELFIAGAGLARGYLNNPELTAQKFLSVSSVFSRFYRSNRSHMSYISHMSHIYKTGDLACWLPDGNIRFLGRMDHQVKIRGFRIELEEIENSLLNHENVKQAVVTVGENDDGDKYSCAYIVSAGNRGLDITGLKEYLAGVLPDYMIPSFFVSLEQIPLTPTGKIDRRNLPAPGIKTGRKYEPPGNDRERILVEIWQKILGLEKQKIGVNDSFFELGGHSLKAISLVSQLHKRFDVNVPLEILFKMSTIKGLASYIKDSFKEQYISIETVEKKEYYPLSPAQQRLYILDQIEINSTNYIISGVFRLEEEPDGVRLQDAFVKLIKRHESFRTSFAMINERPVQKIHDQVEITVDYIGVEEGDEQPEINLINNFVQPFQLSQAPLFRVGLISPGNTNFLLIVNMHHIISDGVSTEIIQKELTALYQLEELLPVKIQYKDYSEWQHKEKNREKYRQQEAYWVKELEGEIPVLALPCDYVRPQVQSFAGSVIGFELDQSDAHALRKIGKQENATLYMVILSITNIFLAKICNQEDIVVGTAAAGRRHPDLERIIGMFVNTLVLKNQPREDKTFKELLQEVKVCTLSAFENQDYPFEDLVEQLLIERNPARNPLFDVMFAFQTVKSRELTGSALNMKRCQYETDVARFDMTLFVEEIDQQLCFSLEYSTKLFKQETILRFIQYFREIVYTVITDIHRKISSIEIISEKEKRRILTEFNDTAVEYPADKTLPELFEERTEKNPDRVALVGNEEEGKKEIAMTYRELKEKSSRLANRLQEKGVDSDTIVGIMVERSLEMMIGVLGILKAGGGYLPINPRYPQERKKMMLLDSDARMLLAHKIGGEQIHGVTEVIPIQPEKAEGYRIRNDKPESFNRSSGLVYVIYTSGSTGRPKGVIVEHRNVLRLVKNTNYIQFKENDRLLQTGALEFDASTFEIWGSLLNGLTLYAVAVDEILIPEILKMTLLKYDIGIMWLTSPLFNRLAGIDDGIFAGLRNLLVGGDVLSSFHINKVIRRFPALNIINGYGPTENTTFSTTFLIPEELQEIPIGLPISNSSAYILDKSNRILPVGLVGELFVGGHGVARGYLNNPELTKERFIENPFCPGERLYRTGDLTRWLPDGNIQFLGRIDFQFKMRGFRIEPAEIENHLMNHENVKEALVITKEKNQEDKYICAYIVTSNINSASPEELIVSGLRDYLSNLLPDYMIPSYFVILERIPLTSNGKVDRKSLPEPATRRGIEYAAPRDEFEKKLVEIWAEILSVDKEIIGVDNNFFQLGGHSLKASTLISKIHKVFNVRVKLTEIFTSPFIRSLASYIKEASEEQHVSIDVSEEREYYPLSSAQKRLYVIHQLDTNSTTYNVPNVLVLEGNLKREELENSLKKLIKRHDSLRTSFEIIDDEPVQKVLKDVEFKIEYRSLADVMETRAEIDITTMVNKFIRPFELSSAPLLRVGLLHIPGPVHLYPQDSTPDRHILVIDMHHIISDAVSDAIYIKELETLYRGQKLPHLKLQYKDFSQWQNKRANSGELKTQEAYWVNQFKAKPPVLRLPTDFPRTEIRTYEGGNVKFEIGHEHKEKLNDLANREDATMFMVGLALFNILLHKITGQEDIVVGTAAAGRRHADLENILGFFVNTLALRNFPSKDKTFIGFLREVRKQTLDAFDNQDYQFNDLVENIMVQRDPGRNPLFDVMFSYTSQNRKAPSHSGKTAKENKPDLKVRPFSDEFNQSKFDMIFTGDEIGNMIGFRIQYSRQLFKRDTIEEFAQFFKTIVSTVIENESIKIEDIKISHDLGVAGANLYKEEEIDFDI